MAGISRSIHGVKNPIVKYSVTDSTIPRRSDLLVPGLARVVYLAIRRNMHNHPAFSRLQASEAANSFIVSTGCESFSIINRQPGSDNRFATVLNYAGNDQKLQAALDALVKEWINDRTTYKFYKILDYSFSKMKERISDDPIVELGEDYKGGDLNEFIRKLRKDKVTMSELKYEALINLNSLWATGWRFLNRGWSNFLTGQGEYDLKRDPEINGA